MEVKRQKLPACRARGLSVGNFRIASCARADMCSAT